MLTNELRLVFWIFVVAMGLFGTIVNPVWWRILLFGIQCIGLGFVLCENLENKSRTSAKVYYRMSEFVATDFRYSNCAKNF